MGRKQNLGAAALFAECGNKAGVLVQASSGSAMVRDSAGASFWYARVSVSWLGTKAQLP